MSTTATTDAQPTTKAGLVAQANAQRAFPQYAGHWDGPEWVLLRAKRDERTKMGLAVAAGDVVLGKYDAAIGASTGSRWLTVYSWRTQVNTALPRSAFVVV
jgi:hypothetical protein